MNYSRDSLLDIFVQNGIFVDGDSLNDPLQMDSLEYVTIIVDIENAFGISFPDQFLIEGKDITILDFEEVIIQHMSNEKV